MNKVKPKIGFKRFSLTFSSWFCVPEQGMKDFEILCRASAFLLPTNGNQWDNGRKFHVITVGHAAGPWRYPKLYPQEWLRFVNNDHTHFTVEARQEDGSMLVQLDLLPRAFYHSTRDLAVLHFEDEQSSTDLLDMIQYNKKLQLTDEDQLDLSNENDVYFFGHEVEDAPFKPPSLDRKRFFVSSSGKPLLRTTHQLFCPTKPILSDGMCGGPVLTTKEINEKESMKIICGMTEGIVPSNHNVEKIRHAAVFVESGQIRQFLNDIEADQIEPLVGGYAQSIVGADQNADKMNWGKILDGKV